jgi:23S rRNA (adenine2030-N6)-methyltransferase
MNYRHGFHAGNFADVQKHVILIAILDYLAQKEAGYAVLDTHAGRGSYDLTIGQAERTREYADGIARLWNTDDAPPAARRYLDLLKAFNGERTGSDALAAYPGSPRIARTLLRAQDRLMACELHPEEVALLKAEFRGDRQVAVHARDGWEALVGLLPPKEKRGLVLIDPPYEAQEAELKQAALALKEAQRKFANGIFALWYPIKERAVITRFHQQVAQLGLGDVLAAELCVWPDDARLHLNGSGMLIVNPPWQLDAQLRDAQPWLWRHLARCGDNRQALGRHDLRWISRRAPG